MFGTRIWMDSWWVWASTRVLLIQTYNIILLVMSALFWSCMLMIYSSPVQKVLLLNASVHWLLNSKWRIWVWCTTSWDYKYGRGLMRFSWVKENIQWRYWRSSVWQTANPCLHRWWWIWRKWMRLLLIKARLIHIFIDSWLDHWCIWLTPDLIYAM